MAKALAVFTTSGNDLANYPNTPFQILYTSPTNSFNVTPGTRFFVPLFLFDDSPPIVGSFPTKPGPAAQEYIFDDAQVGADGLEIIVDGLPTSIGPMYVAGPVDTQPLPDGGGTHVIQVGAFLTPLSKGTHTVTISGTFDGDAFAATYGGGVSFEFTYTVIVN